MNLAKKPPTEGVNVIKNEVEAAGKAKKKPRNVFDYMEQTFESKGPKSLLYKSIANNRRIKVWTRSHSYVRSICTGYLVAFDRFWNLAMIDVDEIYRVQTNNSNTSKIINSLTNDMKEVAIGTDKREKRAGNEFEINLNLYKSGKFNIFQRHVNQMLIRGDNIVFVVLAD